MAGEGFFKVGLAMNLDFPPDFDWVGVALTWTGVAFDLTAGSIS